MPFTCLLEFSFFQSIWAHLGHTHWMCNCSKLCLIFLLFATHFSILDQNIVYQYAQKNVQGDCYFAKMNFEYLTLSWGCLHYSLLLRSSSDQDNPPTRLSWCLNSKWPVLVTGVEVISFIAACRVLFRRTKSVDKSVDNYMLAFCLLLSSACTAPGLPLLPTLLMSCPATGLQSTTDRADPTHAECNCTNEIVKFVQCHAQQWDWDSRRRRRILPFHFHHPENVWALVCLWGW